MERKLLLVFALTFLVIMLFQPILKKYRPQPPAKTGEFAGQPAQNQAQALRYSRRNSQQAQPRFGRCSRAAVDSTAGERANRRR